MKNVNSLDDDNMPISCSINVERILAHEVMQRRDLYAMCGRVCIAHAKPWPTWAQGRMEYFYFTVITICTCHYSCH